MSSFFPFLVIFKHHNFYQGQAELVQTWTAKTNRFIKPTLSNIVSLTMWKNDGVVSQSSCVSQSVSV